MAPPKSGRPGATAKHSRMTQTNKPAAAANKRKLAGNKNGHTGPSLLNYFKKLKPGEGPTNGTAALANRGGSGLFLAPHDDDDDDDVYETVVNERRQVAEVIEAKSGEPVEDVAVVGQDERDCEPALPFVLEYEDDENPARSAGEGVDDCAGTTIQTPCADATEQPAEETTPIATTETVICPICASELVDQTEDAIASHVNSCLDQAAADDIDFPQGDNDCPAAQELADNDIEFAAGDNDDVDYRNDYNDDTGNFDNDTNDDKDISSEDLAETKIKQEPPSPEPRAKDASGPSAADPQTTQIVRNAISQLLVGSRESQKWTAATTKVQRREQRSESSVRRIGAGPAATNSQDGEQIRRCPFYKIMNLEPGVAVDAFRFGAVPNISMYFLTHFHSDHYGGLSQTWTHGKVYCSEITGRLVMQQLRVSPEFVVMLPLNERLELGKFAVTLIDANHCPGSVLFLFETPRQRILHTGDFRASPAHITHPSIRNKHIDSLYLDTTYLSPKYAFPHQADVVDACAEVCYKLTHDDEFARRVMSRKSEGNQGLMKKLLASITKQDVVVGKWLIIVGTYSIGKERMAIGIARKIGAKIFAPPNKRRIYTCLQDPVLDALLTSDPLEGQVHLVSLQEIRPDTLSAYLDQFKPHYSSIVGFRPTGWTYKPPVARGATPKATPSVETVTNLWHSPFPESGMVPSRGSTQTVMYYDIPYSEHSSFRDLTCFCTSLQIGRVIPTVNVGTQASRDQMRMWFDKWGAERRRLGLRKVADGQTRW